MATDKQKHISQGILLPWLFLCFKMAEIKSISNLSRNRSAFIFGLFRNCPVFSIMQSWISSCPKSPWLQKTEIGLFSYLVYKAPKSSWFQNKPFWRVLSLVAIKYQPNSKTLPKTRIWSFCGYFKLLRNYSKWNNNDFMRYKIKKRRLRAS